MESEARMYNPLTKSLETLNGIPVIYNGINGNMASYQSPLTYYSEDEFRSDCLIRGQSASPMASSRPWPTRLSARAYEASKDLMVLGGALFNYQANGYKAELAGKVKVDNADAYKIRLTKKNNTATYFIDANTYMLVKEVKDQIIKGRKVEVETYYHDYMKIDNGYSMPRQTEVVIKSKNSSSVINYVAVEVNKKINPGIFKMPVW